MKNVINAFNNNNNCELMSWLYIYTADRNELTLEVKSDINFERDKLRF